MARKKAVKKIGEPVKVKAEDMIPADAIPVLQKMVRKGDFGKRKVRALEMAITALSDTLTNGS